MSGKLLLSLTLGLGFLSCTTTLKDKTLDTLDASLHWRQDDKTPLKEDEPLKPGYYELKVLPKITDGKVITDPNYFDLEIESPNNSFRLHEQNWWSVRLEAKSFKLDELVDKPFYELRVSVIKNPLPAQTLTFPFSWKDYVFTLGNFYGADGTTGTNGASGKNPADKTEGVKLTESEMKGQIGGNGSDGEKGQPLNLLVAELNLDDLVPPEFKGKKFLVMVDTISRQVWFGFQEKYSYTIDASGGDGGSGGTGGPSYGDNTPASGGSGGDGGDGGDIVLKGYNKDLLGLFNLVSHGGKGGTAGPAGTGKSRDIGQAILGAIVDSVFGLSDEGKHGLDGRVQKYTMDYDTFKKDMALYIGPKLADRLKP